MCANTSVTLQSSLACVYKPKLLHHLSQSGMTNVAAQDTVLDGEVVKNASTKVLSVLPVQWLALTSSTSFVQPVQAMTKMVTLSMIAMFFLMPARYNS